jgi:hypothetical protein
VTEIKEIPNRGHSLTIDSGWREVAETALLPFPGATTGPQPNTPSGSYFSFTRRTRSRLPPQ